MSHTPLALEHAEGFPRERRGHAARVIIERIRPRGAVLLAATALVAGCGGSDEPAEPTRTQATETPAAPTPMATIDLEGDKATAKIVQLRQADLPSGWQDRGTTDSNRSKCPDVVAARETATARGDSPQFSASDTTSAESAVYLYTDDAAAAKAFEGMSSDETRQCLADELSGRLEEPTNGVEIGEPVPERVGATAVPGSDDADAGRITIPLSRGGTETGLLADLAFVRVGRGLVLMTFANLAEPLDEELRIELTRTVAERLSAELN